MTKSKALQIIKKMTVKTNSIQVNSRFVIVKRGRNRWRLGEICGDWIISGTAEEVINRAFAR